MAALSKVYEFYFVLFCVENYHDMSALKNQSYNLDEIYSYLNEFWFSLTGERMDITKRMGRLLLFNCFDEMFRYELLKDNIDEAYEELTYEGKNEFVMNHFDLLAEKIQTIFQLTSSFQKYEEKERPALSWEEVDSYFREFLKNVDSSGDYLSIYEDMIQKKRLVFLDEFSEEELSFLHKMLGIDPTEDSYETFFQEINEEEGCIFFTRKGNIYDFVCLAHEFAHYVTFMKNTGKDVNPVLDEFPSIFYEMFACNFLIQKGVNPEDVINLYNLRYHEVQQLQKPFTCVNHYIQLYREMGDISEEIDTDYTNQGIMKMIENFGIDHFNQECEKNPSLKDPNQLSKDYCDSANFFLSKNPDIVRRKFPYLIGFYLATRKYAESRNNPKVFEDMKHITMSLPNYDEMSFFKESQEKHA